ncbi:MULTISPECIES: Fic family protein [unclassified Ruegeria]|uniref:Fic family protein n=1 Tax=unclassified Ruegeria TaxID=2625375 RepID=UPI0014928C81|nr:MULTISPECIES: Fic family protein [unclassified Ruegeria]NOD48707.1 Fic family protein [Ruegeria sp. HKCCD5849]NOD51991.1 Fic family protein [Ruegeria sp. HKCCD5851]NOD66649.1 Fic family protein [Ruegeria sp. HKCCD7303]
MSRQSGRYIQQIEGYSAFVPFDLPPEPPVEFDDEMQGLLSRADRALGRLDGSIQSLPNPDLFVFMYVRKEAVLSSQIEGTQASLGDILEVEAEIFDPTRPNDTEEILNYVKAMNYGLKRLDELPMSLRLIREIHARLMQGVRGQHATPGDFRKTQNWIGPEGATLKNATFVPPPPSELSRLLGNLETYFHEKSSTPLLIRVGLIHAHFETLHPFLDGNGRMGRLLIAFTLCEQEVLLRPVLYLSHYLKRNRAEYYDRLQAVRTAGDWEGWLKFFLKGVAQVANEATETARDIVQMREAHRQMIIDDLGRGAANGLKLLESLYLRPIFKVNNVAELLEISPQAANSITDRFLGMGLVTETTGQKRNRVFRYDPYVALFAD